MRFLKIKNIINRKLKYKHFYSDFEGFYKNLTIDFVLFIEINFFFFLLFFGTFFLVLGLSRLFFVKKKKN